MGSFLDRILDFLLTLPAVLIALSAHEMMHGYAAYRLGDPTAKYQGRLSLNPLRHVDPFGFICLMLFHVGWAKPVAVDPRYFKKPKRDMAITALAGPLTNFALAFFFSFVYVFFLQVGLKLALVQNGVVPYVIFLKVLGYILTINLGLGVFNLIPVPPLDGSKILYAFLPYNVLYKIAPFERYFHFIMILLLALGILSLPINGIVTFFCDLFLGIAEFFLGVFF